MKQLTGSDVYALEIAGLVAAFKFKLHEDSLNDTLMRGPVDGGGMVAVAGESVYIIFQLHGLSYA